MHPGPKELLEQVLVRGKVSEVTRDAGVER